MPDLTTAEKNAVLDGVLIALTVVYSHDDESIAEDIIATVGGNELLRRAEESEDYMLERVRATVAFLNGEDEI